MPAKSRPGKTAESAGWRRQSTLLLLLVLVVGAFLGGLIWVGHWGLEQLRGHQRYDVPFADIECEPPAGMDRQIFLDEVRYESRLPERLHLLDEELAKHLQDGFAKHRWIEKVTAVQIKPPKHIVVKLVHRAPVMAVKVGDDLRAVDGFGILLHTDAATRGLPVYPGDAKPHGSAGKPWGDPDVESAARKLKK